MNGSARPAEEQKRLKGAFSSAGASTRADVVVDFVVPWPWKVPEPVIMA